MIAEAFDTLFTLGRAALVWIVLLAAVASLILWTVIVTVAWACRTVWRGVAGAVALAQRSRTPEAPPGPQKPPQARVAHSRPTWAQPDEEAA